MRGGEKPLFFILRTFYFVLEYSRLTMLRWFQVNSKGTQPFIYTYAFSPQTPLPSETTYFGLKMTLEAE